MTSPIKIEDHYQAAVDRLPMQFKDKPVIDALFKTWFGQIQELEDDLFSIKNDIQLLEAEGDQLDRYAHLLKLKRNFNETDGSLFGRIATELVGRASEASSDNLRRVVEAVTGLVKTNVIEYSNVVDWENNNVPFREGAALVFGYYYSDRDRIDQVVEDIIRKATPVGAGSTVFGKHLNSRGVNNLWIPCEVYLTGDKMIVRDSADVVDYLVDEFGDNILTNGAELARYGENWELGILPEDNIVFDEVDLPTLNDILGVVTVSGQEPEPLNVAESGLGFHGVMLEVFQTNKQD